MIFDSRPKRGWNILEYVFCCWWTNQELKQKAVKVELLKPTTPKNCIFMPFLDTNSLLTTKPKHFDIKAILKAIIDTVFLGPGLGGSYFFITGGRFFQRERVLWGWLSGPSHISLLKQMALESFLTGKHILVCGDKEI